VHEAVASGEDVDECAELRNVYDATGVGGTKFCGRRIDDVQDTSLGVFHLCGIRRTDGHDANCTIIVDGDSCASLLLNGVDDLALWSDDFAHLVQRNGDGDDLRSALCHGVARRRNCSRHHIEDLESSFLGLL
jgi:hypothetical protein